MAARVTLAEIDTVRISIAEAVPRVRGRIPPRPRTRPATPLGTRLAPSRWCSPPGRRRGVP